jgi:DNA primase
MSLKESLHTLSDRISLKDLVGESVALEAEPPIMRGRCPFHPDVSRALYVGARHFHCFSCGVGGDAVDWAALRMGVSRFEAAAQLRRALEGSS